IDRQRPGRGGVQDGGGPAAEADGGPVAGAPGRADGEPVLRAVRRSMGRLLEEGRRMTTRFRYRTHVIMAFGFDGFASDRPEVPPSPRRVRTGRPPARAGAKA